MPDFNSILNKAGKKILSEIKKEQSSRGIKASGDSAASLKYEIKGNKLIGKGFGYFYFQEFGRGPTRTKIKGPISLQDKIKQWIKEKPISVPYDLTLNSFSYLIARKIHREGYKKGVPRKPELPITKIVSEQSLFINNLISDEFVAEFKTYLK